MKAFKNFKITLFLCAAAVICCVAVLAGTTYAWFSSSATGKVTIQSGTVEIAVTVYGTTDVPAYSNIDTITANTGTELSATTFSGSTYYLIKVNNSGTLDTGVTITASSGTVTELYETDSSYKIYNNGNAYFVAASGNIYFYLSNASSITLTVTAKNLYPDGTSYKLGEFTSTVTNGNTGG